VLWKNWLPWAASSGYPDKWEEYKGLEIKNDSYVNNFMRTSEWQYNDNINKLGTPIDRAKWGMLPQTVNAYYTPLLNEIVFPAAILQPPFFNAEADDAVNYGSMGAVIGHEISHGFDDKGSKFDAKGNLNNWWTAEDRTKFEAKTKILVNQFNKFKVGDSLYVNGELTLGENIADLAGLSVAYEAYLLSLEGKPKENIDGLSPEQRFFVGFAQVWKNNARPEFTRNQVMTDPHSPGKFRVLGPLSNMPEFYNAFGVKEGDKMWRPETDRAKIW
jgi:putative endopeptidase